MTTVLVSTLYWLLCAINNIDVVLTAIYINVLLFYSIKIERMRCEMEDFITIVLATVVLTAIVLTAIVLTAIVLTAIVLTAIVLTAIVLTAIVSTAMVLAAIVYRLLLVLYWRLLY